jgi:hypothetical protein
LYKIPSSLPGSQVLTRIILTIIYLLSDHANLMDAETQCSIKQALKVCCTGSQVLSGGNPGKEQCGYMEMDFLGLDFILALERVC